jgi:hypothetical protein
VCDVACEGNRIERNATNTNASSGENAFVESFVECTKLEKYALSACAGEWREEGESIEGCLA